MYFFQILSATPDNANILYFDLFTKLLLNKGNVDISSDCPGYDGLSNFQTTTLNSLKQRLLNNFEAALLILTNALDQNQFKETDEAALLLEIGKCYKSLNKLDESLIAFLKSAKLNQYSADVFYHIAGCYTSLK